MPKATLSDADAAHFVEAASKSVGLEIEAAHMAGVVQFVKLAAEMAETLVAAELNPDEAPLASVFRLPDPE